MKYLLNGFFSGLTTGLSLGVIRPDAIELSVEDAVNSQTGYLAGLLIGIFTLIGFIVCTLKYLGCSL